MPTMTSRIENPSLGSNALDVWRKWRGLGAEHYPGLTLLAQATTAPDLGEVFWHPSDTGRLCRYVDYPGYAEIGADNEDRIWAALAQGSLKIYRRRYAPLVGADEPIKQLLHEATEDPIPTGTD